MVFTCYIYINSQCYQLYIFWSLVTHSLNIMAGKTFCVTHSVKIREFFCHLRFYVKSQNRLLILNVMNLCTFWRVKFTQINKIQSPKNGKIGNVKSEWQKNSELSTPCIIYILIFVKNGIHYFKTFFLQSGEIDMWM